MKALIFTSKTLREYIFIFLKPWSYIFDFSKSYYITIKACFLFCFLECYFTCSCRNKGTWSFRCTPGLRWAHENLSVAAFVVASLKRIKMFQKQADTAVYSRGGTLEAKRHVLSLCSPRASSVPVARPTLVSFRRTHRQALQHRRTSVGCDKGTVEEMVLVLRFLVFFFFFSLLLLFKNSASRALAPLAAADCGSRTARRCRRAAWRGPLSSPPLPAGAAGPGAEGAQPAREGPRYAASRPPSPCCPFLAPSRWRPGEEARSPAASRERAGTGGPGPGGAAAFPPSGWGGPGAASPRPGHGPLPRGSAVRSGGGLEAAGTAVAGPPLPQRAGCGRGEARREGLCAGAAGEEEPCIRCGFQFFRLRGRTERGTVFTSPRLWFGPVGRWG